MGLTCWPPQRSVIRSSRFSRPLSRIRREPTFIVSPVGTTQRSPSKNPTTDGKRTIVRWRLVCTKCDGILFLVFILLVWFGLVYQTLMAESRYGIGDSGIRVRYARQVITPPCFISLFSSRSDASRDSLQSGLVRKSPPSLTYSSRSEDELNEW